MNIHRVLLLLCISMSASAQNLSVFRSKPYEHASVSVCVLDLNSPKTIAQYQQALSVTPASVLKLLTTGAALEILGLDFKFETRGLITGEIKNSQLTGDLLIQGGGDPSLGSRQISDKPGAFLADWVQAVQRAGIKKIDGRILVDPSAFDDEGVSPFWLWEDIGNYYATGIYGLNVFDNSFKLELKSGKAGTKAEISGMTPYILGLNIENHLLAADNSLDSAYLYGAPYQYEMRLFGTMPANRTDFSIRGQIPDPSTYLALRLKEELQRAGIVVDGEALSTRLLNYRPSNLGQTLFKTQSEPLSQLIRIIHGKSDNFYTECLLRRLACSVSDKPGSAGEGIRVVKTFWQKKGLDLSALSMYDACGLSPNDRISAELLAKILKLMASNSVFVESLPMAGVEGTVSGFLKGTKLEGNLRLKSGSNQVVNSYAGYYRKNGKAYALVMMVNYANESRSRIRKDMETFLLSL
ncbi:MAG TPA: D-alanyl-D-alanine carboxypeptidase/D-alanyl-D-alanine-endopeptidase [Bacteroidales bacterium]|nr:D-alanyl-D-alanine carboxypeptidase/D-alanyl-D-alanine-endopeptidase [Bacteroidales bacterium]